MFDFLHPYHAPNNIPPPPSSAEAVLVQNDDAGESECCHEGRILIIIDNSNLVYFPVRLRRSGMYVMCRPDVLTDCSQILSVLDDDLQDCLRILPISVRALLKRTKIWINHKCFACGRRDQPDILNHTTAHHHEGWLMWARDRPDKTLGVEIYSDTEYLRMRNHWNGCGLILHELCHLIHQVVLGLDCSRIRILHAKVAAPPEQGGGKYERVLRRDWAGKANDTDLAYATVDHKEFFAEMSVTYWSKEYQHLDASSHVDMSECCPVLTEPRVLNRIQECGMADNFASSLSIPFPCNMPWTKRRMGHCNKFYPFTCGQLKHYDPELHCEMDKIWNDIAKWDDPYSTTSDCWGCWDPPWRVKRTRKDGLDTIETSTTASWVSTTTRIDVADTIDL